MPTAADAVNCPGCNRAYRWKAEVAGRKVKCKCGEKFTFPEQAPSAAAAPPPEPEDDGAFGDLIASLGTGTPAAPTGRNTGGRSAAPAAPAAQDGMTHCPSCGGSMRANAVICMSCGHDLKAGRSLGPVKQTKEKASVGETFNAVGLKLAGIGFLLEFLGGCALGVGLVVVALVAGMSFMGGEVEPTDGALIAASGLALVAVLCLGGGMVAMASGPIFFLAAPNDAGRFYAVGSLVSFIALFVLSILIAAEVLHPLVAIGNVPLFFASQILMVMFYVAFASYFDDSHLEHMAERLKTYYVYVILGSLLMLIPIVNLIVMIPLLILEGLLVVVFIVLSGKLAMAAFKH